MTAFDPSSAQPAPSGGFDPGSARAAEPLDPAPAGGFDPTSAHPAASFDPHSAVEQVSTVVHALQHGKPVGKALASAPALRGAAHAEADLRQRLDLIKKHPVEGFFDVLSSGQRAVGSITESVEKHRDLRHSLGALAHDVFMTPDETQNAHIRAATTESIRALFHAPTHNAVDHWVESWAPKQLQPYAKAIMKGGEDLGLQTVSDPTTLVGGVLFKTAGKLIQGAHTAVVLHAAAEANGAGKMFEALRPVAKAYAETANRVGEGARTLFKPRADLDRFFTEDGRRARLSIENAEFHAATERRVGDEAAIKGGTAAQRLAMYERAGVRVAKKYTPQEVAELSADEQAQVLRAANDEMRNRLIAQRSRDFFGQNLDLLRRSADGSPVAITNWNKIKTFDESNDVASLAARMKDARLTGPLRDLMRVSIFLNPLPHGFKNVGQLAYLAGGFPAIFRGMKAMLPAGRDPAVLKALREAGALPSYTQHTIENSIWNKVIPGWSKVAGGMQDAMTHMEAGWRAGLWETLAKKLPGDTERDRLVRAAMVNEHLGDYRNQSAFVHFFESLGGPFVAFRLGIVPHAVARAIAENPQRVLTILRSSEDLQRNRDSAQRGAGPLSIGPNELNFGGPVEDAAKMLPDGAFGLEQPLTFLTSPSTLGPLGEVFNFVRYAPDHSAMDELASLGARYIPGGELAQLGYNLAAGGAMPNQKMTLTDRLISSTLEGLAVYFARQQTLRQQHLEVQRIRKEGL